MIDGSRSNTSTGTVTLAPGSDDIARFEQQLLEALLQREYGDAAAFAVRLALQEALTNAFVHGNHNDATKEVTVRYAIGDREVELEVIDQGDGFDVASVPDPTAAENLTIPSGRGIMLMSAYMTDVEYVPPGNRVRMRYRKAS